MKKRKKHTLQWLFSALIGFGCAVVLGVLFYGTMVYQLAGEGGSGREEASGVLALPAALIREETQNVPVGAEICSVLIRTYALDDGLEVQAVTASPAIYFERVAQEGFLAQLVTGFSLAGMEAVLERSAETGLLASRSGDTVYLLSAKADDQTLYTLGAAAVLEENGK